MILPPFGRSHGNPASAKCHRAEGSAGDLAGDTARACPRGISGLPDYLKAKNFPSLTTSLVYRAHLLVIVYKLSFSRRRHSVILLTGLAFTPSSQRWPKRRLRARKQWRQGVWARNSPTPERFSPPAFPCCQNPSYRAKAKSGTRGDAASQRKRKFSFYG